MCEHLHEYVSGQCKEKQCQHKKDCDEFIQAFIQRETFYLRKEHCDWLKTKEKLEKQGD